MKHQMDLMNNISDLYNSNRINYKTVINELYNNFLTPEEKDEIESNLLEDKWEYLYSALEDYNEDLVFYAEDYIEEERKIEFINYMLSKY